MSRPFPLVEYAKTIGKPTQELTAADMAKFMTWWMKQPIREDIISMGRKHNISSFQQAQTSRLAEQGIESPINNGEEEIVIHEDTEIVCSMELTKVDVKALIWAIGVAMNDYNVDGEMEVSLKSLLEGLEGV
jgi:hypothetical protein